MSDLENMRESPISVLVLNSATDTDGTKKFKVWRMQHKARGRYLNKSSEYGWVLHRARSGHIEMPDGADLTSHEKVCANGPEDMKRYLAQSHISYHRCLSCNPG